MIKTVLQVKANPNFTVYVYFADGRIKLFDMNPYLNQGIFSRISDLDSFLNKCTVMNGTLAWDLSGRFDPTNCIDLDPETVYSDGLSVKDPLETQSA